MRENSDNICNSVKTFFRILYLSLHHYSVQIIYCHIVFVAVFVLLLLAPNRQLSFANGLICCLNFDMFHAYTK